jgi:hypothetical protein
MGGDTAAFPLSYHKAQARPPRREGQALRTDAVPARPPRANMRPRKEDGAGQCRDAGGQGRAVLTRPGLRGAAGRHSLTQRLRPPGRARTYEGKEEKRQLGRARGQRSRSERLAQTKTCQRQSENRAQARRARDVRARRARPARGVESCPMLLLQLSPGRREVVGDTVLDDLLDAARLPALQARGLPADENSLRPHAPLRWPMTLSTMADPTSS